jgi:hypothetical protein
MLLLGFRPQRRMYCFRLATDLRLTMGWILWYIRGQVGLKEAEADEKRERFG